MGKIHAIEDILYKKYECIIKDVFLGVILLYFSYDTKRKHKTQTFARVSFQKRGQAWSKSVKLKGVFCSKIFQTKLKEKSERSMPIL